MGLRTTEAIVKDKLYPGATVSLGSEGVVVIKTSSGTVLAKLNPTDSEKKLLAEAWADFLPDPDPPPDPDPDPDPDPPPVDNPVTAAFTFTPANPIVGQVVTFNAESSVCADGPCKYEWTHGTTVFGTAATATFTYKGTGDKTVNLKVEDADGDTNSISKTFTVAAAPVPDPPPPPPPPDPDPDPSPLGKLPYAPPPLSNPITVTLTSGNSPRDIYLNAGQDYILIAPQPINGGLRVHGGRNIICMGLHVRSVYQPYSSSNRSAWRYARRGVQFENFTGHLFIEGLRQDGGDLAEGLTVLSPSSSSIVTVQNYYCALSTRAIVRWINGQPSAMAPTWGTSFSKGQSTYDGMIADEPGKYWDEHNDCYQSWQSPLHTRLARCTFITPCQVNSQSIGKGASSTLIYRDIDVHPLKHLGGKYYSGNTLSKGQNGGEPEHSFVAQNVWFEPGDTGGNNKSYYTGTYSQGSTAWESQIKLIGVDSGFPGQFVDPNKVGVGYVSPGYM